MTYCNEIAVFEVAINNQEEIIKLSLRLFTEMNLEEKVLISHQIMKKTDNPEHICWHLVWKDEAAVALSKAKWSTYPSAKAIESLVNNKLYYGHFLDIPLL